jgi:epoxyqueuosine reductase
LAPGGDAPLNPERRSFLVRQQARALGFDAAGITDLQPTPHADRLRQWLENGMAGTMRYMHRQAEKRQRPADIAPGATRAIVVTRNYSRQDPPERPGTGLVARYARGRDYHDALRGPLAALAEYVRSLGPEDTLTRTYVDAGPVPERELAQRAGIGWIGKNTMLIDPRRGSFFFLGTVLTDLELAIDPPFEADRCGSCRLCLDACPTDAFPQPRVLDSRRCISYLTIEYQGERIRDELADAMGDRIFGCDICQDACPWNEKFAEQADDKALELDEGLARLDLAQFDSMDDDDFDRRYGWTPLERPGLAGMRRNARVARLNRERNECHTSPKL